MKTIETKRIELMALKVSIGVMITYATALLVVIV